jgi:hypothetical protein
VAVGVVGALRLTALLSTSFAVPGTESERARTILADHFDERTDGVFTVVVRSGNRAALRHRLSAASAPSRPATWDRSVLRPTTKETCGF